MRTKIAGKVEAWCESLWWSQRSPPLALIWLSRLYTLLRNRDQLRRIERAVSPPLPMISVGNITVGGSGKTPFVIWLAVRLQSKGFKPVILCRGDGGKLEQARVLSEQDQATLVGDEARLLFESCSCPVIAGKDRIAGAMLARKLGDILILDDGFQYRQLKRLSDIVLIPTEGIGNGWQLPAGPLREPLEALNRAHVVVRTGSEQPASLHLAKEWRCFPCLSILKQLKGPKQAKPEHALAISSIARPQRFIDSLKREGIEVKHYFRFPDHHRYAARDIKPCLDSNLPLITTTKDAVKLVPLWPKERPLWVLEQQGQDDKGLLDAILAPILSQIEESSSHGA
ncbi:MAG: tetraacyldisaccharide 4'-kinase [Mariprofundaceae bacterium]